jgi:hypothetical protein
MFTLTNYPLKPLARSDKENMVRFLMLLLALLLALTMPVDSQVLDEPSGPQGSGGVYEKPLVIPPAVIAPAPFRRPCPPHKVFDMRAGICRPVIAY